jgi:phage terminase large subunit-like protein
VEVIVPEIVENPEQPQVSVAELVKLCAINNDLYCRTFFPQTFRQKSPSFDKEIWDAFDDPRKRNINVLAFRGAAKTTRARAFTSKRIAYGVSRTILYIGSSEDAALRSIRWIKNAVEKNKLWSSTFGVEPGDKWAENEIEIRHKLFQHPIWIIGVGITSTNIRGINFDDYRPDLIVGDDVLQDENSATQVQREKIAELVLTAIKNSLISRVEEPNAKMVLLNTPQHREDFSQQAKSDPEFSTIEIPCWTKATWNLPVSEQESVWPELYPSTDLRAEKLAALKRNRLSQFTREKEVKLTTRESASFLPGWLNIEMNKPVGLRCVLGIDPVPPPSEQQLAKGLQGKDYEALYMWGQDAQGYHLLDWKRNHGHEPNWTCNAFFELCYRWRPFVVALEAIAYQRTLKWIIEQEMKRRRMYYMIDPVVDKRKKQTRIISVFSGIASQGQVFIGPEDTFFAEQFENYSEIYTDIDDDLDASAMALSKLINPFLERSGGLIGHTPDEEVEELPQIYAAP